jgi:hypothetical protein
MGNDQFMFTSNRRQGFSGDPDIMSLILCCQGFAVAKQCIPA